MDDVSEAFLLAQVCQELEGADQVDLQSNGWSMWYQDPGVFRPAACLDRQYLVCLPAVVLATHHALHCFFLDLFSLSS